MADPVAPKKTGRRAELGFAIILILAVSAIAAVSPGIAQGFMGQSFKGTVTSATEWMGENNTPYSNITVAYQGNTMNVVLPCTYYHVGSAFPLVHYPKILWAQPYTQEDVDYVEIGC